jgi:hypothetical protein
MKKMKMNKYSKRRRRFMKATMDKSVEPKIQKNDDLFSFDCVQLHRAALWKWDFR